MNLRILKKSILFICITPLLALAQNRVGSYYISGHVLFPKKAGFYSDYQIYLINSNNELIKTTEMTHGGNKAFFILDSVRLSNNYTLYIKKLGKTKDDELFLMNNNGNKKIAKFSANDTAYLCKIDASWKKEIYTKHSILPQADTLIDIEAKILYGPNKNKPLKKHKIFLVNNKGDTIRNTVTGSFGDFEFKRVKGKQDLQIKVENTLEIKNEKELYVAQQNGTIVYVIKRSGTSFTYRMLPSEQMKLAPINDEDMSSDAEIKINAFSKSADKEIIVAQNIYYPVNGYTITPDAADQLDVMVDGMTKNPTLKLEITSHTDSQGDDAFNLNLSNQRAKAVMDYLIANGVDKSRLTAIGMGEKHILNRCTNGVSCSEKEHELNRRTEFKFTK
ncbi:MAG: OmpA family protein [Bacteroidetes bacterium]|nr:OmpA family protein [Bacteroidota bacterium]